MIRYTEKSVMPFGKHSGKLLSEVPADYLLFIYYTGSMNPSLRAYIEERMQELEEKAKQEKYNKK